MTIPEQITKEAEEKYPYPNKAGYWYQTSISNETIFLQSQYDSDCEVIDKERERHISVATAWHARGVQEGKEAERWVPVSERLPKPHELVWINGGVAFHDPETNTWRTAMTDYGRTIQWEVTHWKPLPSLPENL